MLAVTTFAIVTPLALLVASSRASSRADALFDGDATAQEALADTVAREVLAESRPGHYESGNERFDGQSAIAIDQMALVGLGQVVLAHPELRDRYLPAMRHAALRLVDPEQLTYATRMYGHHGLASMPGTEGHAYLGYVNLGLSMMRVFDPDGPTARTNDQLTEAFLAKLAASPHGIIETYPDEAWPPDVAAVVASIGLHARATGRSQADFLASWAANFADCAIDRSGYVVQRLDPTTCEKLDGPRGSGTAIAAYFLSFATPELAHHLYTSLAAPAHSHRYFGLGGVDEYVPGEAAAWDLNAGPMIAGMSVGASGFALGASRAFGDRAEFAALYRSTSLLGLPSSRPGTMSFAIGGALGDALLLAMLTARSP